MDCHLGQLVSGLGFTADLYRCNQPNLLCYDTKCEGSNSW